MDTHVATPTRKKGSIEHDMSQGIDSTLQLPAAALLELCGHSLFAVMYDFHTLPSRSDGIYASRRTTPLRVL